MIHLHVLSGCAPTPLAHYLKALAILRLVSEQADPRARGAWRNDCWLLTTELGEKELIDFFMIVYRPTPLVAPWNGGTGFYRGSEKSTRKKSMEAVEGILQAPGERFDAYREAIALARAAVGSRTKRPEKGEEKDFLVSECFRNWRGPLREAIAAAIVPTDFGKLEYPSLFGTGFNVGNLDFTSNFMGRLLRLFAPAAAQASRRLLEEALWKQPVQGMDTEAAIGQFLPGGAGGANSTTSSGDGNAFTNPWDFVLMLEGGLLFSAAATRRFADLLPGKSGAPFTVRSHSTGSGSVSAEDEKNSSEQWMPLWKRLMTLGEVRQLLAEGRAQVGAKPATRPLDFARAVSRLGVARGLVGFERYGYLERNGQANLAIPLGRIVVSARPRTRLIDDLDPWLDRLHRAARTKGAPARLQAAERRLADAVFAVLGRDDGSARNAQQWQAVLVALTAVESVQATGTGIEAGPVPRLRPDWVEAVNDGSGELRLALALAGAAARYQPEGDAVDSIRHHFLPLDRSGLRFAIQDERLARDARVVAKGRDPVADLLAIVERRVIEGEGHDSRRLALRAAHGAAAQPADLAALLSGQVGLAHCLAVARALMALDWRAWHREQRSRWSNDGPRRDAPDDAWLALRLALLPWPLDDEHDIRCDPAIVRRLSGGDAAGALEIALRRLRAKGMSIGIRAGTTGSPGARLWGAALAFPISQSSAKSFARRLQPDPQGA